MVIEVMKKHYRGSVFIGQRVGQRPAVCAAAVHAVSALGGDTGCTSGAVGDVAGELRSLPVSVAPPLTAVLPAAAAAVALATIAANDVLGVVRSVGSRAAAVDGTTGSWNTFATRI